MATILVIDDDVKFRQLVRIALEPARHAILEAGRASEAEAILATTRPDLVIRDGLLPDADGSRWIGERRKALGIPFIFASAFWKASRDRGTSCSSPKRAARSTSSPERRGPSDLAS